MDLKNKSQLLLFYFQQKSVLFFLFVWFFLILRRNYLLPFFMTYVTHFDSPFSGFRMVADDAVTNSTFFATR